MTRELLEEIAAADMVLVGIGEEFEVKSKKMEEYGPYRDLLKEIQENESKQWMNSYLMAHFLQQVKYPELEEAYQRLNTLLKDKNFYIISTCMDGMLLHTDIKDDRVVLPCGGYRYLQCEGSCTNHLIPAEERIQSVFEACSEMAGKLEEVKCPVCEKCGKPLVFNNIYAENYDENGYLSSWNRYTNWLQGTLNRKLCIVELGVSMKYPSVIRWPFEKMAFFNQKSSFFRIHSKLYHISKELAEKGVAVMQNPVDFLRN